MDVKNLMSELIDIQMGRVRDMRSYVLKDIDGDRFPEPEWLSGQMSNSITMAAQLIAQYVKMNDFNDDDIVVADIEIVATPQGNILHQILEQRQPRYSISARLSGYGSTTDNVIDDGFIITHCDIEIEGVPSVAANID